MPAPSTPIASTATAIARPVLIKIGLPDRERNDGKHRRGDGRRRRRLEALAVSDGGIVTAPGSSPVTFAIECLRLLHPDRDDTIAEVRAMFAGEIAPA